MASDNGGFSGTALTVATVGGMLIYFGIRNVPVLEGLRSFLRGEVPTPRPSTPATLPPELNPLLAAIRVQSDITLGTRHPVEVPGGGTPEGSLGGTTGNAISDAAKKYLGVPYVWGGHSASGMDCSGLVTVALKDVGITNLPSMVHTVTTQFLAWSGAANVARSDMRAGDLVCWEGHIGIAVDNTRMIHAPTFGDVVKISTVWNVPPPVIRRVKEVPSVGRQRAI